MKLTTFLMIIGCIHVSAAGYSQKITLTERNVSLESVLHKMEKQSGYTFFSNSDFIGALPNVSVNVKNATLSEALDLLLSRVSLSYSIVGKTVVITPISENANGIKKELPLLIIGAVLDEQGKPIPGANVKVKGTIQRTVTDKDGKFRILVTTDDAVLQISYVGYQNKELAVKEIKSPFIIKLKAVTSDLDQIQVMAYTTTTKRLNTSNSVTITAEEIAKHPVNNILDAIKDRVPGLFVEQRTGNPGGSYNVTIRGTSSFGTNAPLYIIDGVSFPANGTLPFAGRNANSTSTANQFLGGNALNYLNPADVESIDILKDADATAIYGSRGAFGVILITTKKGKQGKPRLNVNSYTGFVVRGSFPKLLNTDQYLMLRREALKNDGLTPSATDLDLNGTWPQDRYTNWQKELMGGDGLTNTVNATYSGGSGNTNFLIGTNYNKQGSIQLGKGSNRGGGARFDINNTSPDNKFYIDFSGSYSSTVNDAIPLDFSGSTSTLSAPNAPPLYLPNGQLNWETGSNPLSALNLTYRAVTNNLIANTEFRYKPVKGLTLTTRLGYNVLTTNEFSATPTTYFNPAVNSVANTTSYVNNFNVRTINIDPNARYEINIGKKSKLSTIVGATLQDQSNMVNSVRGTNFTTDALLVNPATAVSVVPTYNKTVSRYIGFFGVLNYNWDNKYILDINARTDGSTKFAPGHRFGTFGSIGGAWLISEEKWFKDNISFISFAKLNGSIGTLGGDGISNYQYLDRYQALTTTYQQKPVLIPQGPSNPDLHWEKKNSKDIALNLEFFKGRISILANYFKNVSSDLLTVQQLADVAGFQTFTQNTSGEIENKGYEFSLRTRNVEAKNFSWSTYFQISVYRNKLLSYDNLGKIGANYNYIIGKTVNGIKLLNYAGVDPATGNYFFVSPKTGTGQNLFGVNPNTVTDRTEFADLQPRYFGSISNTFSYKAFTVDFTFTGRKRMGLNFQGQQPNSPGYFNVNSSINALDRWQKPGDITDVPKATTSFLDNAVGQANFKTSTGAYEMITYAKLQNLSINYNFNADFLKKAHINVLSVFLRGENLLTISKYGNMDPENLSVSATPPLRVFTAGFNITL